MSLIADSCGQISANFVYGAFSVYLEGYQSWISRCRELNSELTSNEGSHLYCDVIGGGDEELRESWWISNDKGLVMAAAAERWVRRFGGGVRNPILVVPLDNHIYYASFHLGVVAMDAIVTPEIFAEECPEWKESGRNVVAFNTRANCVGFVESEFETRDDWLFDVPEFENSSVALVKNGYIRFRDASLVGVLLVLAVFYWGISFLAENRDFEHWQPDRSVVDEFPFYASGEADTLEIARKMTSENLLKMRTHGATNLEWNLIGRTFTISGVSNVMSDMGRSDALRVDWPDASISSNIQSWIVSWNFMVDPEVVDQFRSRGRLEIHPRDVHRYVRSAASFIGAEVKFVEEVAQGDWRDARFEFGFERLSAYQLVKLRQLLRGIPMQVQAVACNVVRGMPDSCKVEMVVRGSESA